MTNQLQNKEMLSKKVHQNNLKCETNKIIDKNSPKWPQNPFSRSTLLECGPSLAGASASDPVLIGWDKSCDIRNIDDTIVCCQQGHILQQV